MKKADARRAIDALGLTLDQAASAQRSIGRATTKEEIEIVRMGNGDVVVRRSRPGHVGHQVFETIIRPDGGKTVVQMAFDADGNLVHFDPKGGAP